VTYTSVRLDHSTAKTKLESSLVSARLLTRPNSRYRTQVESVILGSHLTYRYILITNLLAKAVNGQVNALALQSGADFNWAFDSRSLCHDVIVPFEREFLQGRLGRSNEPYLNKPARHKALSTDNAVRKGNDRRILDTCISILSSCSSQEAEEALVDALYFTLNRPSIGDSVVNAAGDTSTHETVENFSGLMLRTSNDGEGCALLTGLAFHLLSYSLADTLDIRVHPVNQSGASSREVLDVDVYVDEQLRYTAEVKDKPFMSADVDHAANKVQQAGHAAMFFVVGPSASSGLSASDFDEIGRNHGVSITVVTVKSLLLVALGLCTEVVDHESVWRTIAQISTAARFKQTTNEYIQRAAAEAGLIE